MAILMLCRSRARWTAPELAEQLEVSVRTIYRDVSALQQAGVPLWTESGPGGGIRLLEGWRSELEDLSGDEAAALFLSGVPSAVSDLGLGAVTLSAQLKVRSALPPELRTRAARVQERFHLDAPGWFHRPEALDRGERVVRRRVDPLGLVLKAGVWYLVARHRGQPTTYRVGRVLEAHVRAETFERPDGFDLAQWWSESSADFDRSLLRTRCRLRLSPAAQRRLPEVTDHAAASRALADRSLVDGQTGWATVWLECESDEVVADQLLGLGEGFEVLEPAAVRARVLAVGEALVAHHDGHLQLNSLNT
jgi:predicted DNA-binding transcriptional regulator YafY